MSDTIIHEEADGIATLTLNRPLRHNSLIPELLTGMRDALQAITGKEEIHAVVLQANGHSFSTGDLSAFYEQRANLQTYAEQIVGLVNEVILTMLQLPQPIICAVQGNVNGGSLGFLLAADIVYLAPEVTITPYYAVVGFSADGGWTAILPSRIGRARAAYHLLTNHPITAPEAVSWGLAANIIPAWQLQQAANDTAARIAGEMKIGGVTNRIKQLLAGDIAAISAALEQEKIIFTRQIRTTEALQGLKSFLKIE